MKGKENDDRISVVSEVRSGLPYIQLCHVTITTTTSGNPDDLLAPLSTHRSYQVDRLICWQQKLPGILHGESINVVLRGFFGQFPQIHRPTYYTHAQ